MVELGNIRPFSIMFYNYLLFKTGELVVSHESRVTHPRACADVESRIKVKTIIPDIAS